MQLEAYAIPPPGSHKELELLVSAARNIQIFSKMTRSEQDELLHFLEAYECLGQVIKLLDWRIQNASARDGDLFSEFLWLMRVYYLGLEDFDNFVATASRAITTLHLPFAFVRMHIAEGILGPESFHEHALLYAKVLGSFSSKSQRVLLLERLALIYEKKLFLEADVDAVYAKLIDIEPENIKALKFYKFFYLQTNQFREAAAKLEKLMQVIQNPFEKQRVAHELAQTHLYSLNEPGIAREILEEHCLHSRLDTNQTFIEALERLGAIDELIDFLRAMLNRTDSIKEKTSIELHICAACLKSGKFLEATVAARAALVHSPDSFLAHESLLSAHMELGDIDEIVKDLESMKCSSHLDSSKDEIDKLIFRGKKLAELEDCRV